MTRNRLSTRSRLESAVVLLALTTMLPLASARATVSPPSEVVRSHGAPRALEESGIRAVLDRGATCFVENRGQADPSVAFYLRTSGGGVAFTSRGLVYALASSRAGRSSDRRRPTVALDFVGSDPKVRPIGQDVLPSRLSYFRGTAGHWRTGVRTYASVLYSGVWPGIDLVFHAGDGPLKYSFVVKPGADPDRIRLNYRGVTSVRVDETGQLVAEAGAGALRDEAPRSFQEVDGRTVDVATAYRIERDSNDGSFGFRVADFDRSRTLVVDPAIVFSGFLGGSDLDSIADVAVDSAGAVYVVGGTLSQPTAGFPVAAGPDLTFNPFDESGLGDAYVAKIKPDGSGLEYCGYIGGSLGQMATGVAVDAQGNAYVTGATYASQFSGFPVTVGPRLTDSSDRNFAEGFIAKVSADGAQLLYCGYIGGNYDDFGADVAVDTAGNAYVTGVTRSDRLFPVGGGLQASFGGGRYDAFVSKVKADGSGFVYSGYIGGGDDDLGLGIAVGTGGSAYVTGWTASTNLPAVGGPRLAFGGGIDAFVAGIKSDGSGLAYLGYLGGSGDDIGTRIAVDSSGSAYVTGTTSSPESSFPVLVGPDLTYNGGGSEGMLDGFVTKVKPDGSGLVYSGYIGGSGDDSGGDIAVDSGGNAWVTGATTSTAASFPLVDAFDATFNGGTGTGDAFVAQVKADGSRLLFSSYLGGGDDEGGTGIAVAADGTVYVAGTTFSTEASFPVATGPFLTQMGSTDGFVAKLRSGPPPPPSPTISSVAKSGKFLVVTGANIVKGAKVLVNGTAYKAKPDAANPTTVLKSKKAGKVVQPGDSITVRNPDGSVSNAVTFTG